jgi:hypothetical protein
MDARELGTRMKQGLEGKCLLEPDASFRTWTVKLFELLKEIGTSNGYEVYHTGNEGYLLDFAWYDKSAHEIDLGVEIEWGQEDERLEPVSYDFEKLMHVKCPLKFLIYQVRSQKEAASGRVRKKLEDLLSKFTRHREGEEYLLLEFSPPWRTPKFFTASVGIGGQMEIPFAPLFDSSWSVAP